MMKRVQLEGGAAERITSRDRCLVAEIDDYRMVYSPEEHRCRADLLANLCQQIRRVFVSGEKITCN